MTTSRERATWAAPCGWASTRPTWRRARSSARPTATPASRNGTGTATRSTTPTATSCGGRHGLLRHQPRSRPGRVRRAAPRRAPLLRRHPGPPRAPLPADPTAPAVQGADRRRARPAEGAAVPDRRDRAAPRDARGRGVGRTSWPTGREPGRPESSTTSTAATGSSRSGRTDPASRRPGRRAFGRIVLEHPGAVVMLAIDDEDRAVCLSQYRHAAASPVRRAARWPDRHRRGAARGSAGASSARRPGWRPGSGRTCSRRTPRPAIPPRSHYFLARGLATWAAATSCWPTRRPTWSCSGCRTPTLLDAVLSGGSRTPPWRSPFWRRRSGPGRAWSARAE